MDLRVFEDGDLLAAAAADAVEATLTATPTAVLGLPTGRSPLAAYAALRRRHAAGHCDFSRASTFNLDEFVGLRGPTPGSFRRAMDDALFTGVNLDPSRIHFLDGTAADLDAECRRYDDALRAAGPLDLLLLGIGANGHIGFNEPGEALRARTHRVLLADRTRADNAAAFGGDPARVPAEALSMGMGAILQARRIVLLALGAAKAEAVARAVEGAITTRLPASFLQLHPAVTFYLDPEAAAGLRERTVR